MHLPLRGVPAENLGRKPLLGNNIIADAGAAQRGGGGFDYICALDRRSGRRFDRALGRKMADNHEEIYGEARVEALRRMLRALAQRILELDRSDRVLQHVPELLRRLGDLRSELFHYEVRSTYDTPEISEHRRLVEEARQQSEILSPDPEDDE